jgi:hypothetical protein
MPLSILSKNLIDIDLVNMFRDQSALVMAEQLHSANGHNSKFSINQMQIQQAITDG